MKISGPFLDRAKRARGYPKPWYLRARTARLRPDGSAVLDAAGRPVMRRERPFYASRAAALADLPRLRGQLAATGIGATGVLSRAQLEDFEAARRVAPGVAMADLARFWRLHHPAAATQTLGELVPVFLVWVKARLGETRHVGDLKSRLDAFAKVFGARLPATFTREEFLAWLLQSKQAGRTVLNQKRAAVNFFNWLAEQRQIPTNPLAGIKKRLLPRSTPKEIAFLPVVAVNRYLRAAERYDPDLVAHEIIQLFAGVRADDEMEDFCGEFVKAATREIVIPAEIAKTGRREVIGALEDNFWAWWASYGRAGRLRPAYHEPRWKRVRVLAAIMDPASPDGLRRADELARLPVKTLLARSESKAALQAWPWNARRRTFCTYHVAKHQSAALTALILRHRGEATTLHNSYRGTGVTQAEGTAFFALMPNPVAIAIRPRLPATGIVRLQRERASATAAA